MQFHCVEWSFSKCSSKVFSIMEHDTADFHIHYFSMFHSETCCFDLSVYWQFSTVGVYLWFITVFVTANVLFAWSQDACIIVSACGTHHLSYVLAYQRAWSIISWPGFEIEEGQVMRHMKLAWYQVASNSLTHLPAGWHHLSHTHPCTALMAVNFQF